MTPSHCRAADAPRVEAIRPSPADAPRDPFKLIEERLPIQRRVLRAGDTLYRAGDPFAHLHVIHSGLIKLVHRSADGREQVVALTMKRDWLGFDGIAQGHYDSDAVAMDTGEIWSIRYDALLQACTHDGALTALLHEAMSHAMSRDRQLLMSLCTLTTDARVAEFLRRWTESLGRTGLRTDQITLRLTRAEIGSYLGMTLESVSRALTRLARERLIHFAEQGRRELRIPDVAALGDFVQGTLASRKEAMQ